VDSDPGAERGGHVRRFDYLAYSKAIQKYLREVQEELKENHVADKLHFDDATKAAGRFAKTANALSEKPTEVGTRGLPDPARLSTVNHALLEVERNFLLDNGLRGRSWFRHAFYAPGVYTGYAGVVTPAVREAVERKDWTAADEQLGLVRVAVERGTATLTRALETLGGTSPAAGN